MTSLGASGSSPIEDLRNDHRRAMRLVSLLVERVERLRRLEPDDVRLTYDIFRYMVDFVDRRHHAREDRVIAVLLARDPSLSGHVAHITRAHDGLRIEGETLLRELAALRERRGVEGRAIVPRLSNYTAALASHFSGEERELFDRAELLTEEDWRAIDAPEQSGEDPLFGPQVDEAYARLFEIYVGRVLEIGAPPRVLGPLAAAVLMDSAAALIGGARQTASAIFAGSKQTIKANVAGVGVMAQSRSLLDLAAAASSWTSGTVGEARAAARRLRDVTKQATASTLDPMNCAWTGSGLQLEGSHRIDRSPPSWQAHLVNLGLRALIKRTLPNATIASVRQPQSRLERMLTALDDDVAVTRVQIGGGEAEIFEIDGVRPERTVLHLPGGGFVIQAAAVHRLMAAKLARQARARVVLVHYRLAPEHPYPAGLDDCMAAYRYLVEGGTDPASIVLSGDSAGGCLALLTLQRCRAAGLPMPAAAVAISPLTDLTYSGRSRNFNRWFDPSMPNDERNMLAQLYLGDVATDDPMASPLFGDASGLPPVLIQVGSVEVLLDDALRMAAKIRAQGGECECEVWHEMPHDFVLFGIVPEARKALSHVARFVERHTPAPAWTQAVPARRSGAVERWRPPYIALRRRAA
ncbi:MAG: alpha/beta hydrolase fold domain-containing protein [Novosphingobium sp.]